MKLVEWDIRYETGIKDFDSHHQHLLNLLNRAYETVVINQIQNKNEIEYLLHELIDYAGYHFNAEEELLKKHCYPWLDSHIHEHDEFAKQIMNYVNEFIAGEAEFTVDIILFLEEWLLNHISKVDKKYARFLIEKGVN
jgi:hemerythrin